MSQVSWLLIWIFSYLFFIFLSVQDDLLFRGIYWRNRRLLTLLERHFDTFNLGFLGLKILQLKYSRLFSLFYIEFHYSVHGQLICARRCQGCRLHWQSNFKFLIIQILALCFFLGFSSLKTPPIILLLPYYHPLLLCLIQADLSLDQLQRPIGDICRFLILFLLFFEIAH